MKTHPLLVACLLTAYGEITSDENPILDDHEIILSQRIDYITFLFFSALVSSPSIYEPPPPKYEVEWSRTFEYDQSLYRYLFPFCGVFLFFGWGKKVGGSKKTQMGV